MNALECAAYGGRRLASNRKKNGYIHKGFSMIVAVFLFSAGNYLFSINQNAVHGYRIRTLEKEIASLEKERSQLQSSEAEMRSLDRTKEAGARMGMERTTDVISVERLGTVALR
jgi:cell division protein FtsL